MISRSIVSVSNLLAVAAVLVVVGLGGDAFAKKRIVVAPFTGRGAEDAHDDVEDIIEADATVVSQNAYKRAAKKVRGGLSDENVAKIASDLQVEALIEGDLAKRRRGGYTLEITVRDGATGAVSDTISLRVDSPRLSARELQDLTDQLTPALAKVGELAAEPVDITPKPDETETENPLTSVPPPADPVDTPPPPEDEPVEATDEFAQNRWLRHAAADVQAGVTAGWRNLRFTFADGLANSQKPNGYKGSIVPSLFVLGEIYPVAFSGKRSAMNGLGVSFVFDRVLLLKSKLRDVEYDTSQTRFGFGLRYRFPFGKRATLPTLKIIAGWNHLDFTINRGTMDIDLPNVSYSYLDAGLYARFPLGTPKAAIYADARYMILLGAGEIEEKTYYGGGSRLGIDADLGIELTFLKRAILRVGGRYQRIAFDFDGSGMKTNRDNTEGQDVGGALDQYISAYATAGYLF